MLYELEHGPREANRVARALRDRREIPRVIREAPELAPGLELYWSAWRRLSTCRSTGWSVGPIPWTAVHELARAWGLDAEEAEDLEFFVMDHLDPAFRDWAQKQQERQSGK